MAVHNGAKSLPNSLDSVLSQVDVTLEAVVIDDGSTDESWPILERRAALDCRLKPHRSVHVGLTQALRQACELAQGQLIARHDVGDWSAPNRLALQRDALLGNPDLSFVASRFVTIGPAGEVLGEPQPSDAGRLIIESLRNPDSTDLQGPHHGSLMFRRSAYEQVGGYRPEFYFAQDLDLWTRLIEVGDLAFVNEVLYQVQFSPGSITALHRPEQQELRGLIREATIARRRGEPETEVLRQAAKIRPAGQITDRLGNAEADYFIGSCLHRRRDPAAATYLRRVIKAKPFHLKAWAKLFSSRMLHQA